MNKVVEIYQQRENANHFFGENNRLSSEHGISTIIYVETGQAGGGSFGSLDLLVSNLDKKQFKPVVIFLNRTRWVDTLKKQGIDAFVFSDIRYSLSYKLTFRRITNKLARFFDVHARSFYVLFESVVHYRTIVKIQKIIAQEQASLVHSNNQPNRDILVMLAAKRAGVPCISHIRSHRTDGFDAVRAKFTNKTVARYISASQDALDHWVFRGIDRKAVSVIYNGIDEKTVSNINLHKTFGFSNSIKRVFGAVGTLNPIKGHAFLIKAFADFVVDHPNIGLLLVGDGSERSALEAAVDESGIRDNVIFAGFRTDATSIIASLDVLIQPSINENCSRVLLESLLYKTPVIATNVGGNSELIKNNNTGLLCEYGNIASLVSCLNKIYDNSCMMEKLSNNGYDFVTERFSVEQYVSNIELEYHKALSY